jgi:hypothetical protein
MERKVRRAYRPRYHPTMAEKGILERYARAYGEARDRGASSRDRGVIVAEAKRELMGVSAHLWGDWRRERYEVRQWFNRWLRRGVADTVREKGKEKERQEWESMIQEGSLREGDGEGEGDGGGEGEGQERRGARWIGEPERMRYQRSLCSDWRMEWGEEGDGYWREGGYDGEWVEEWASWCDGW